MASKRLPWHRGDGRGSEISRAKKGPLPVPAAGEPALPARAAGVDAPLHGAGRLGFVRRPGRDHWWEQLSPKVRDRMVARVGPVVEWWAYCHRTDEQRPYAVVLGERGLAECTPTTNDRGGPAQLITVVPFVPSSLRHAVVVQRAGRRPSGGPPLPGVDPPDRATGVVPLTERMRGFLGNLPPEAQSRLQWPFVNGDTLDRSDRYYVGSDDELDIWCYLAGRRWVTFVSGHGTGLSGPAHRASWRLVCRQAEVAVR
ncbi:hypothetical protein [Streptomyces yaizuensis]|uniref:Uncharacterized protein n=1 Tax=Streptomyces yaizuensis TaxID=2989713 RepID=A0ABQ5PAH7_9ACTN|nr:hypothetical protein [Streptomyces sp. YSPA8]GLF99585.1 hypothetical protein SYYSPA8_34830 [Streptomyces sp. YSPA8]